MSFRIATCAAAVMAIVLIGATSSFGQTNAVQDGNWSTAATWSNGEPDGTAATTPTTIDGGFTVTIDTPGEFSDLLDVGSADGETGNLNITGGDLFLTDLTAIAEFSPAIRLGQAAGSTGNLTMSGGTVFIDGDTTEPFAFARGDLMIGDNGTGTMTMTGGILDANDEIFMAFGPDSSGSLDISGGTLETVGRAMIIGWDGDADVTLSDEGTINIAGFTFSSFLPGSTSTITQTGGTFNSGGPIVLARQADSTYDHSGGAITTNVFIVADNFPADVGAYPNPGSVNTPGATGTYNISDGATLDVFAITWLGAWGGGHGIVNQTGGTLNTGAIAVGRDGTGTYNMSGGVLNQLGTDGFTPNNHFIVGQVGFRDDLAEGTGFFHQTGGDVTIATGVFLGDLDNSEGTYKISGGTLNVTGTGAHQNPGDFKSFIGDFSVGGALASNAPNDTLRVDPANPDDAQGQALDANGTFIVSGSAATINIAGNFLANPADKHDNRSDASGVNRDNSATLVFEIFDTSGTSLIDVAGVADLDGAVIDLDLMGGFTPSVGTVFDLLTASAFGATGTGTTQNVGTGEGFTLAAEDAGSFNLGIVAGGNGEILQATFLAAPGLEGDYNMDGSVDAADYVVWRKTDGSQEGYDTWRENFGATATPGSGLGGTAQGVPEPAAGLLLLIGAALGLGRRVGIARQRYQ